MNKLVEALLAGYWSITEDAMANLIAIAQTDLDIEALEKKAGARLSGSENVTVRDGIAIVPIDGPIFAKETFVSWLMGWPSYDSLAKDFNAAVTNPNVNGIILKIDSPGGAVNGASEFAQHVKAARGTKPIVAYVGGTAASAAYWIASQADSIKAVDTAIVGSIGTQLSVRMTEPRAGEKTLTFTSAQSPLKNADPGTEAGSKELQQMVDALAEVFVKSVADGRGTTSETVLQSFGQGGVFVAQEALKRGMVDGIATFESVLESIKVEINNMQYSDLTAALLAEHRPDLVKAIREDAVASVETVDTEKLRAEAVKAERDRIVAIEALAVPGTEELIAKFKAEGTDPGVAAQEIVKAVQAKGKASSEAELEALKNDENAMDKPNNPGTKDEPANPIAKILADAKAAGVKID